MGEIEVYQSEGELMRAAAERFVSLAGESVRAQGRFAVALSGGSTPRSLYKLVANEPFVSRVDWTRVYVFWGDERAVPADHHDSNFRMTKESLLQGIRLPPENIHRVRAELAPKEAALDYEQRLKTFFRKRYGKTDSTTVAARFDLILLGMGSDGHTASVFPGSAALQERERWVVADYVEKLEAWRITLTPVVINAARHVLFLVSGGDKASALRRVLSAPYQPDTLPAQVVQPEDGDVTWMLDAGAAALL